MDKSAPPRGLGRILLALLVMTLISWAVFTARIYGELNEWGAPWVGEKGKQAGGGGALLGVSWLMPIAGLFFGWAVARTHGRLDQPRRAITRAVIGFGCLVLGFGIGIGALPFDYAPLAILPGSIIGAVIAGSGWAQLGNLLLVYGALVRVPIAILTYPAVFYGWGTHMEKMPPESPAEAADQVAPALASAQVFLWIPATVILGCLFAAILAAITGRRARPEGAPA